MSDPLLPLAIVGIVVFLALGGLAICYYATGLMRYLDGGGGIK